MSMNLEEMIQENPMDKLYVITRAQLNPIYQCVQGGHAVAAWIYYNLIDCKRDYDAWNNGYLIYLNTYGLDLLMEQLDVFNISYTTFSEPDMGGCITAIACYCDGSLFKDLKLVR